MILLFSIIHDVKSSQIDLNENLDKINNWTYHWKMSFNPDPSKKTQEVIFSRKVNNVLHPLTFINIDVGQIRSQKHLGMFSNLENYIFSTTVKSKLPPHLFNTK